MHLLDPALGKALALSVLLHALLFAVGGWLDLPARRAVAAPAAPLDVTLRFPEAIARPPPLVLGDAQPAAPRLPPHPPPVPVARAAIASRSASSAETGPTLAGEAARLANLQLAKELLYPAEAIARGLEGQVLVLLFLDASGNAIAARLEASSGYALLDDAALRAARTLRALPDSAPREALLPVRFRLR